MIQYLSSDIIWQAKVVGGMSNVNMPDFDIATTFLNSEYQKLYDKIVMANGANIKEVEMMDDFSIPEDCYHIIGVYRNGKLLDKSSLRNPIKGTYYIVNNEIKVDFPVVVKYSTLPQTLTSPDAPIALNADIKEVGFVEDDGFYFKDSNDTSYYFNFSSMNYEPSEFVEEDRTFLGYTLDFVDGKVFYNDTDVTYIFEKDYTTIKSVRVSNPYAIINYEDQTSAIYYCFESGNLLNWNESKGKETLGEVLGFTTNDITGKGCIWKSGRKVYWTSFTPDTVLNYPSNTFFQLLIYRLAAILTSLNGVPNQYLVEKLLPDAEVAFEEHLAKDNVSTNRMVNVL